MELSGNGVRMNKVRDREKEKALHTCGHLSPVSKETDPPLTGVYAFLLLWDDDVVGGRDGVNRQGL